MLRKALFLAAGITLSTNLSAISVDVSELPADVQACHTAGTCQVILDSFFDMPNTSGSMSADGMVNPFSMNAFYLVDTSNGQLDYLLRYNVVNPSATLLEDTVQLLAGNVWLRADSQYSPGVSTTQLYLDRVDPLPWNFFVGHTDGLSLDIELSQQALLGGSGHQQVGCCDEPSYTGNMSILSDMYGEALLPCLAEGCYASAHLNLLYLLFSDPDGDGVLQLDINPFDSRGLLFAVHSYDPYGGLEGTGSGSSQSYYVSSVPLPPALYFLGWGLLTLIGCARAGASRNRG